jgi:3-hydroxymyristoyl/3-hydroxydecanoyl-(acyl carrier protein) dehydratase
MTASPLISLQRGERRAEAQLSFPSDSDVFRGHFPNMPVLPGVVQIDWVMRLAEQCFRITQPAPSDFQVKFSRVITPDMVLRLILAVDPAHQRLTFEYRAGEQIMSSGRVKIEMAP